MSVWSIREKGQAVHLKFETDKPMKVDNENRIITFGEDRIINIDAIFMISKVCERNTNTE